MSLQSKIKTVPRRDSLSLVNVRRVDSQYFKKLEKPNNIVDIWSVKKVPNDFGGKSKSSTILKNFVEKQKKLHENAMENMRDEFKDLHEKCVCNFEELGTILEVKINGLGQEITNLQNTLKSKDLLYLEEDDFEQFRSSVEATIEIGKILIDKFYDQMICLDNKRKRDCVPVFFKCFLILKKICYLNRKELHSAMEEEITTYNMSVVENYKSYVNTQMKMRLDLDKARLECYRWLEETKKERNEKICRTALKDFYDEWAILQDVCSKFLDSKVGKSAMCRLSCGSHSISNLIASWDVVDPYSMEEVGEQVGRLETAVTFLDTSIQSFLKTYQTEIFKTIGRLADREKNFKQLSAATDEEKTLVDLSLQDVEIEHDNFIFMLEQQWNDIFEIIKEKQYETLRSIKSFNSLLNEHYTHASKFKDSVKHQLKDISAKQKVKEKNLEKKINADIAVLRREESLTTLDTRLKKVLAIMDNIVENHKTNFQTEKQMIKTFSKNVTQNLNGFETKVSKYVKENEPVELDSFEETDSLNEEDYSCQDIIFERIHLYGKQIDAIEAWKSRFVEHLLPCWPNFVNSVKKEAEDWENRTIVEREQNFDFASYSDERLNEYITSIYEVRQNEIMDHNNALEIHNTKIKEIEEFMSQMLIDIPNEGNEYLQMYQMEVSDEFLEHLEKATNSGQIKRLQFMCQTRSAHYKTLIETKINDDSVKLNEKFEELDANNEVLLESIILWQKGGTFGTEEAKTFKKKLLSMSKDLQKAKTTHLKKLDKIIKDPLSDLEKAEKTFVNSLTHKMENLKFNEFISVEFVKCENQIDNNFKTLSNWRIKFSKDVEKLSQETILEIQNENVYTWINYIDLMIQRLRNMKPSVPDLSSEECSRQLFGNCSIDTNHLLHIVVQIMIDTFSNIRDEATKYFKNPKCIEYGENYDECMADVLRRMQILYEKVKLSFTKELKKCLKLAEAMKNFLANRINKDYDTTENAELDEAFNKFKAEINEALTTV